MMMSTMKNKLSSFAKVILTGLSPKQQPVTNIVDVPVATEPTVVSKGKLELDGNFVTAAKDRLFIAVGIYNAARYTSNPITVAITSLQIPYEINAAKQFFKKYATGQEPLRIFDKDMQDVLFFWETTFTQEYARYLAVEDAINKYTCEILSHNKKRVAAWAKMAETELLITYDQLVPGVYFEKAKAINLKGIYDTTNIHKKIIALWLLHDPSAT